VVDLCDNVIEDAMSDDEETGDDDSEARVDDNDFDSVVENSVDANDESVQASVEVAEQTYDVSAEQEDICEDSKQKEIDVAPKEQEDREATQPTIEDNITLSAPVSSISFDNTATTSPPAASKTGTTSPPASTEPNNASANFTIENDNDEHGATGGAPDDISFMTGTSTLPSLPSPSRKDNEHTDFALEPVAEFAPSPSSEGNEANRTAAAESSLHGDGSTQVEKWTTTDDGNVENDDDDADFDSLLDDDPEVIRLQMNALRMKMIEQQMPPVNDPVTVAAAQPVVASSVVAKEKEETTTSCAQDAKSISASTSTSISALANQSEVTVSNFEKNSPKSLATTSPSHKIRKSKGMGIRDMVSSKDTLVSEQKQHRQKQQQPRQISKSPRRNKSLRPPRPENVTPSHLLSQTLAVNTYGVPTALFNSDPYDGAASELSDVSHSPDTTTGRTIATETLRVILQKIELAKAQLLAPQNASGMNMKDHLNFQIETAQLIEKLAMAASALKTMHDVTESSVGKSRSGRNGA